MENLPTYRLTQSGPETQEILNQVNLNTVDIEQLKRLYQALTQSEPEIIEPTDTWPVANPEENVIYRVIDRVNTPPQYYTDYMWNGTSMVPMAQYDNAIDNEPTANSSNLVKSGGVYSFVHANGGVYDISAAHPVGGVLATYDDLEDALGTDGANVPAAVRKGGMSIKFVQTSDNKYVRFDYLKSSTADADIANIENWVDVTGTIEYTRKELGEYVPEFTLSWGYLRNNAAPHSSSSYKYSSPILLKKGQTITVKYYSADFFFNAISLTNASGSSYSKLVSSDTSSSEFVQHEASYIAQEDVYVALCGRYDGSTYTLSAEIANHVVKQNELVIYQIDGVTFDDALLTIPDAIKKRGLIVKYADTNKVHYYVFVGNVANITDSQYWIETIIDNSTTGLFTNTNHYVNNSGIVVETSYNVNCTDYIYLPENLSVYNVYSGTNVVCALYDKNKEFITAINVGGNASISLDLSNYPTAVYGIFNGTVSTIITCNTKSVIRTITKLAENIKNTVRSLNGNLFDTEYKYINKTDGWIKTSSNQAYAITDYLPMPNELSWNIPINSTSAATVALYDKDMNFLVAFDTETGTAAKETYTDAVWFVAGTSNKQKAEINGINLAYLASLHKAEGIPQEKYEQVDIMNPSVPFTVGSYINTSANISSSSTFGIVKYDVVGQKKIRIRGVCKLSSNSACQYAFYSSDSVFSSATHVQLGNKVNTSWDITLDVPSDAKVLIVCAYAENYAGYCMSMIDVDKCDIQTEYNTLALAKENSFHKTFNVGANTFHYNKTTSPNGFSSTFYAKDVEDAYIIEGGNRQYPTILSSEVIPVEIDDVNMYACHFGRNRIYFSAMRQFTDANNDYLNVTARFLAYCDINTPNNYVKIIFPEDFPNAVTANGRIHQCFETNDGGLVVEVENGVLLGSGKYVRQLYKIAGFQSMVPTNGVISIGQSSMQKKLTYINETEVTPLTITGINGTSYTSGYAYGVKLLQCWGLSIHGHKIVLSGYDQGGRNACVYYSDDDFNTVKMLLNGASDSIQVDVEDVPVGRYPSFNNFSWNNTTNGNVHVHGVAYDPYYDRIWVVTGDGEGNYVDEGVTGIYYTDDLGVTWKRVSLINLPPFVYKTQLVSIIPLPNCVLFATDGTGDGYYRYNRNGKDKDVQIELSYQYLGRSTSINTIPAGSCFVEGGKGCITIFPYGQLNQTILSTVKCGLVYSPNGYSYQLIYQEANPVGEVANSVIHRRSIVREYDGFILVSAYNSGYLKLSI